jgi:4-hydroxy-tetrahydrodipicolinate synthase
MPLPKDMDFKGEMGRLRPGTRGDFAIGYSGDWGAADALLSGADAWYSVVGGLLPEAALKLVRAAQVGDVSEVRRIDSDFQPLWGLFKEFGSIRVMYAAADILSLCEAVPPRPILPLPDANRVRVTAALDALSGLMQP